MKITKKFETGGKVTFALSGRLDASTSPELQDEFTPAFNAAKAVFLDLAELSYISSAGLRILLMGQKIAMSKKIPMTILNPTPDVLDVLEKTGFAKMLTIV